jgi:succinate dehydrogenase/fumarate reductase flavoprotein subunit
MDMSVDIKTIKTDVLVAGSGGAGFRAAIGAREKGAKVFLVSKGRLARSGASPMAGADLTCHGRGMRTAGFFGEPNDSEEKFFSDIVHQGSFLNNQRLTELYVRDGPQRLLEMLQWGMKVDQTDERAVYTTGPSIVNALHQQARRLGVQTADDIALLDLYLQDGRIAGGLGLDLMRGEFIFGRDRLARTDR